jgi:hypothetical protein
LLADYTSEGAVLSDRKEVDPKKEVGLNVRIAENLRRRTKAHCALTGETVESFVSRALKELLMKEQIQEAGEQGQSDRTPGQT